MSEPIIKIKDLSVVYKQKKQTIVAVDDVDLEVEAGDIYGIVGYSGAGKSTLVRTINLLQVPTAGFIEVDGHVLSDNKQLYKGRLLRQARHDIGMIFQHFNLLAESTVVKNVEFALRHSDVNKNDRNKRALELLELVGLSDRANNYPSQLSGGQKQRVAIARALANDPKVLISDEATSALDPKTTRQILDLLKELNQKLGITIVIITHEMQVVKEIANKVAVVQDGKIIERGSTVEIFSNPKEPLTKEFIGVATGINEAIETIKNSKTVQNLSKNQILVELAYKGQSTGEPVINNVYDKYKVSANILFGNVEILNETPIGSLIVVLDGTAPNIKKAIKEFQENKVTVNVLKEGE
ncbi:MAG: methionine ABC transporter ATP-binding protein [Lactobacillaceae bacterium]|jgi:D-methionine transport system ATP-binding protein|nr:methionine ABC transporter ATP-binding protein [Lactobacillaceae bacterium]